MANLLGGRLVFNAQDKHWYLYEMTGTQDSAKGPEAVHADQHASQGYGFAVWGTDEAGKVEQGLNWKPVQSHFYASYHFGRLGYYARVSNGTLRGAVDTSTPHYLRAGFAGLGLAVMSSTALINPAIAANILPQGGTVTSGSGTVSTINNGTGLQIKQNSQVLGLNWNSFSIGVGNQVVFDQPNSTSVAINRVIGNSRSEIFGSLQANGQVFLLNPNGVLIARTAQIDTGAFVAAAAQDAQRNANGSWTLSGISNADVINQGNIRATGDGGFVVLAGAQVTNEGSLQASSGIALAAGESVSLALDNNQLLTVKVDGEKLKALVQNKGLILADGGAVYLTAVGRDTLLGTVVNNEGVIQARGVSNKQGRIILSGTGGDVLNSGKLDVSGKAKGTKGGLVALNGNRVAVTGGAVIDASGVAQGGRVIIGGDQLGIGTNKSVLISNIQLGGADSSNYRLVSSNFSAVSSIINNTSTATTNTTVGLTFSDEISQKYTATVISRINKIEFTQPAYTYLHTVKQNSDYLQVDYIERGVNITVSGR